MGSTPHDFVNLELRHHQYVLNVKDIFFFLYCFIRLDVSNLWVQNYK